MRLQTLFEDKYYKRIGIASAILVLIIVIFEIIGISKNDVMQFLLVLIGPYLNLAELIANSIIKNIVAGVTIQDHSLVFSSYTAYYFKNQDIIDNWQSYLLFLKWSVAILASIWIFNKNLSSKITYTVILAVIHFISVISGLVLIAGIGPRFIDPDSLVELRPHIIGSLLMFGYFVFWLKRSRNDILRETEKLKIKIDVNSRKFNEFLGVFLIYMLLKSFFVPYFNYYFYIDFLLNMTQWVVGLFGYTSTISGPYLKGEFGTLYMAKWCLGFVTMLVFASMIFLTRTNNKTAWIYILSGVVFLHVINILRLSVLFIYVQHHSSTEMIMDHHDIYNIIVYIIIFLTWVLWFEKFVNFGKVPAKKV